jgi:saccharopine dehydrogenase (NAD+, L-lysine-forming)
MKIGIITEYKHPPDARAALNPEQCDKAMRQFPDLRIVVEPSPHRGYEDEAYRRRGIPVVERLDDCDVLLGIKEVPIDRLLANKTYCFFSHTIKQQAHNRDLLRAILVKRIHLIDYEAVTDEQGRRLIAFGRFAGMVGAHNAMWTYGRRSGEYSLPRLKDCLNFAEAKSQYAGIVWPPVKIVLTGTGRVGSGAADVLRDMGIRQVPPDDFLNQSYREAVFTQLRVQHYAAAADGRPFNSREYYQDPSGFVSIFAPYYRQADIMINGIYWDKRAPAFFTREEMRRSDFRIQVIADITCDIAPESSIPSTIRASCIADPVYGYDPVKERETPPFQPGSIDVMAIDNLPSEIPRDATDAFGEMFIGHLLPEFFKPNSDMLERATVAENGTLSKRFQYLSGFLKEKSYRRRCPPHRS